VINVYAQQNYFIPINIQKAYNNQTRSYDGNPGKLYWQNTADYNITASIIPESRILSGSETIKYFNNSPDSLSQIVIRLYQNINRANVKRDFIIHNENITEGMKIDRLLLNDSIVNLNDRKSAIDQGTNLTLFLKEKLPPKSNVKLNIDWNFTIPPRENIRMGMFDSTTFFIAYWFPQVSVYDDIDGWDKIDYAGTVEMYNDFNNFDVTLTVPKGFHIWSTGVWQNADEVLNQKYFEKYKQALKSDEIIRIITKDDLVENKIYKSSSDNVFKFKAEKIPDFAFGLSDHYLWDATSFKPDANNERRTYVCAAYNEASKDFADVAYYAKESLSSFSTELPGVPYPFPSATVFNGSGGMEFPMIVNNGSASTKAGTVHLTSHELYHQYMPFYMGVNERKYAFMDEGLAVMIPFDFQTRMAEGYDPRVRTTLAYTNQAGKENDLPLMVPSVNTSWFSYRMSAYNRPAMAYELLRNFLGDDVFKKALREYMHRWNGKHPIPNDFFFTFNEVVGEDLAWFWKPWFYEFGYPDLSIEKVELKENKILISIGKKGDLPVPVKITLTNTNKESSEISFGADVWKGGNKNFVVPVKMVDGLKFITLGSSVIPDVNQDDNVYELK
jgi:hypothetical protein